MKDFRIWRFLPCALLAVASFYLACWGVHRGEWWGAPTFFVGFFGAVGLLAYAIVRGCGGLQASESREMAAVRADQLQARLDMVEAKFAARFSAGAVKHDKD